MATTTPDTTQQTTLPVANQNPDFQTQGAAAFGGTPTPIDMGALTSAPKLTVPTYTPPPTPDISKLALTNTPQQDTLQTEANGLTTDIAALTAQQGTKADRQNQLEAAAGLPDMNKQLTELTAQLKSLQNDNQAIPLAIQNDFSGRGATAAGVQPIQDAALRRNAIKALGLSAAAEALQGNISLAQDHVNKALAAEFDPLQAQIDAKKTLLATNRDNFTTEEKRRADALNIALDQQKTQVANARADKAAVYDLVTTAAQQGADNVTLNKMLGASNKGEASAIAASAGLNLGSAGRYKDTITTTTDAFGNQHQTVRVFDTVTGQFVNTAPGTTASQLNSSASAINTAGGNVDNSLFASSPSSKSSNGLSFDQYGLLAHSDFNPNAQMDQLAQKYLDTYLKKGALPSTRDLGNGIKAGALAQIDARARSLYQQATGQPLPNPEIIKGYQQQLIGNNKLVNNLNVQEGTINANAQLLLSNLKSNNINGAQPYLNNVFNPILNAMGDPNVAAYLAQNITVQNELGSLLALKNAQGTTVHDKLEASGLIPKGATAAQISSVVQKLLSEAQNAHDAIQSANVDLYKQTDPLLQDANNPIRGQAQHQSFVEDALTKQNLNYNSLLQEMQAKAPAGHQPALDATTGKPVFATQEDIRAGRAVPL